MSWDGDGVAILEYRDAAALPCSSITDGI